MTSLSASLRHRLTIIITLSVLDGIATLVELHKGLVTELNPFMDFLFISIGPFALLVKTFMTFAGVYFIMRVYQKIEAKPLNLIIHLVTIMYVLLALFHVYILAQVYPV